MKKRIFSIGAVLVVLTLLASSVYAQYDRPWYTSYQVVNIGDGPANINVSYYDADGQEIVAAARSFSDVPKGGSQLVLQYDEASLGTGAFSAVISADQPVAAIVNQQTNNPAEAWSGPPPFSTYSGQGSGSKNVTLPAVMYNWYNYYTDVVIMNVGAKEAKVTVQYVPGTMMGAPTGSAYTAPQITIPQFATESVSQETMTQLGAASGTFVGRFLGSAILTSDEPVVVVVNQHNVTARKLMTYNGFVSGANKVAAPSYMRHYYGYYTTLLVANPSASETATVEIQYIPDTSNPAYNAVESGSIVPVTVEYDILPQTALTRYDGYDASDAQSDLDDDVVYTRFFGSVVVSSTIPVMVQVNVEARAGDTQAAQAGSYNGIAFAEGTNNMVAPVILADFYGFYTAMIVQNVSDQAGYCDVTYTSDGTYSAVKNQSKTYRHNLVANGSFTVYEGRAGGVENGDINSDLFWRSGAAKQWIGAATLECTVPVVGFVNEEKDVLGWDSMYTMNTFNIP